MFTSTRGKCLKQYCPKCSQMWMKLYNPYRVYAIWPEFFLSARWLKYILNHSSMEVWSRKSAKGNWVAVAEGCIKYSFNTRIRPSPEKGKTGGHFPVHRCRSGQVCSAPHPQGGVSRDGRRFERIFPRPNVFHHRRKNGLRYLVASDLIKIKKNEASKKAPEVGPSGHSRSTVGALFHPGVLSQDLKVSTSPRELVWQVRLL